MRLRSLRARVALSATVAVGVALALAGAAIVVVTERSDRRALDSELRAVAERLRTPAGDALGLPRGLDTAIAVPPVAAALPPVPAPVRARPPAARRTRTTPALPPRVIGRRGRTVAPFGLQPAVPAGALLEPGGGRFARAVIGRRTVTAGRRVPHGFPRPQRGVRTVELPDGERWRTRVVSLGGSARLEVAAPVAALDARSSRLRRIAAASVAGGLLATALLASWLAGLALAPLARLRAAASRVRGTEDLGTRVGASAAPEEVAALAAELDGMLERLERAAAGRESALASARRFAADAGHELRTPLTGLRANLEVATDERTPQATRSAALAAAGEEAARLRRLVDGLQALARGEAGLGTGVAVDLADLADAAVAGLRVRHPDVEVVLDAPDGGPVLAGDPDGLRRALDNLLENAARHGRPPITVTVSAGPHAITVDDAGPGIPEAERPLVTARFVRGTTAVGDGTGLGLAIVAAEAERHGLKLELSAAHSGGLRARLGA